jgi:hypothetical protein
MSDPVKDKLIGIYPSIFHLLALMIEEASNKKLAPSWVKDII